MAYVVMQAAGTACMEGCFPAAPDKMPATRPVCRCPSHQFDGISGGTLYGLIALS